MAKPTPIKAPILAAVPPQPKAVPETFEAFTTLKVPGGYSFLKLTVDRNMAVIAVEASEPDMKAITTEKFKIAVGRYWQKQET